MTGIGRLVRGAAFAIALLVLGASAPVFAQARGEYTVGIGDELEVTVWQRPDLGGRFAVDSEGNIALPLIGSIRAAGQSVSRLGEELTRRFSFVDRDVSQVTVAIARYNSRRVFVLGEVLNPGPFAFAEIPSVWDVLREAGGPTADAALSRVRVIPPEGSGVPIIVDLERILSTGDFASLPALRAGSTILVPKVEAAGPEGDVVYVYGRVARPGVFSIDEARTVLQAVLLAGGPVDDADMDHVRVVRPGPVRARVFAVDLDDYVEEGVLFANMSLLPGDTVTVPRSQRGAVWGAFREVTRVTASVLGSLLFFTRLGDDDNNNNGDTTIIIEPTDAETP